MNITLFGLAGTGKGTIGPLLAEKLSRTFVSAGSEFRKIAKKRNITPAELERLAIEDEKIDTEVDQRMVLAIGHKTNFIVDGRLAFYWINDGFNVMFTCANPERFRRISIRENISVREARKLTLEREEIVKSRWFSLYALSFPPDPALFDLIIHTDGDFQGKPDLVVDNIIEAFNNKKRNRRNRYL